ncbi:magnesium transporter [Sulfurimonas aquatica]|uniref:Magnesium transporter n=1 Tax=Sulfurimonas aquatica TaxID=2672570 RepID=A0A975AZS0_9BACT|nr:CorA family divalent cation transporter [Sulfurimonas aquatica]QSZ41533.1 magnesium transporter [Sulfurimonas aquatica]
MQNVEELIDKLHLEDLHNEKHPAIFDENETYDMLILRIPVITDELNNVSLGFILTKENSYFYNIKENKFEELNGVYMGPYTLVDKVLDKLLKSFLKYAETISDMEESLYSDMADSDFLNNWLAVKLEILRIERVLLRTATTMEEFIDYNKDVDGFPMNHYVDIHEHMERTMRSAMLQLSKLDYLYSFYNAKSNDKMNKMIYILTIISAIFLPLNLLVGFFGMNTTGLPFATGEIGTYYAVSIMMSMVIITSLFVQKWRKKIER